MYPGNILLLIAWAVYRGAPVNGLGGALFVWWMDRFQVPREERAHADTLDEAWDSYRPVSGAGHERASRRDAPVHTEALAYREETDCVTVPNR